MPTPTPLGGWLVAMESCRMRQPVSEWMPSSAKDHQQYLARPGSRPYCSAQPSGVALGPFEGSRFLLPATVWQAYDWTVDHCVLRGANTPIPLS